MQRMPPIITGALLTVAIYFAIDNTLFYGVAKIHVIWLTILLFILPLLILWNKRIGFYVCMIFGAYLAIGALSLTDVSSLEEIAANTGREMPSDMQVYTNIVLAVIYTLVPAVAVAKKSCD